MPVVLKREDKTMTSGGKGEQVEEFGYGTTDILVT